MLDAEPPSSTEDEQVEPANQSLGYQFGLLALFVLVLISGVYFWIETHSGFLATYIVASIVFVFGAMAIPFFIGATMVVAVNDGITSALRPLIVTLSAIAAVAVAGATLISVDGGFTR